jgi:hypothetical protein
MDKPLEQAAEESGLLEMYVWKAQDNRHFCRKNVLGVPGGPGSRHIGVRLDQAVSRPSGQFLVSSFVATHGKILPWRPCC